MSRMKVTSSNEKNVESKNRTKEIGAKDQEKEGMEGRDGRKSSE